MCLCSKVIFFTKMSARILIIFYTACSLNRDIEDAELQSSVYHHFEQWGHLLGVKVLKDWLKRPYAFVQYQVKY
jgi:hypothetical protein